MSIISNFSDKTYRRAAFGLGASVAVIVTYHSTLFIIRELGIEPPIAFLLALTIEAMWIWLPVLQQDREAAIPKALRIGIYLISVTPVALEYSHAIREKLIDEWSLQPPPAVVRPAALDVLADEIDSLTKDIASLQAQREEYTQRKWFGNANKVGDEIKAIRSLKTARTADMEQLDIAYRAEVAAHATALAAYKERVARSQSGGVFKIVVLCYALTAILVLQAANGVVLTVSFRPQKRPPASTAPQPPPLQMDVKYTGVTQDKTTGKWTVTCKGVYLGSVKSPETGARIYDFALLKMGGEHRWLNFPELSPAQLTASLPLDIREKIVAKLQKQSQIGSK